VVELAISLVLALVDLVLALVLATQVLAQAAVGQEISTQLTPNILLAT
jgi:hypothetical protein